MTFPHHPAPANSCARRKKRGAAILLSLAVVVLMALFAVSALLMSAQRRTEAAGTEDLLNVRNAADSAVNVALAQLREATSQTVEPGVPAPWTSQPGAVRVHRMDGSLRQMFKLYTSDRMIVSETRGLEDDVPYDWASMPECYVDLNEPVLTPSSGSAVRLRFPIVDPRAKSTNSFRSAEGFDYDERRGPAGVVGPGRGEDAQRLPMPVRWVYQLEDGTLGTVSRTGQFRGFNGSSATRGNRIVARFAFWTDDESCKININTAAEGAFWDVPRADTRQERNLAAFQPLRTEYQRQPGHPAGVCLSSVLMPGRRFSPAGFKSEERLLGGRMGALTLSEASDLWSLARLADAVNPHAGSMGGTQAPGIEISSGEPVISVVSRRAPFTELTGMLWDDQPPHPGTRREQHSFFRRHPEAVKRLARGGFFLTAQSAAPETTLFGTPRIALWPVHGTTDLSSQDHGGPISRATDYDYGIARAATVGGRKYYLQRLRPGDGAWELERGSRGENLALFDYLRHLTAGPVPGWLRPKQGFTSFAEKFGPDRDGILLSMLDYIRAANFSDGQLAANIQFPILCPGNAPEGFGQISPLSKDAKIKGLGRILTVSEVALVFVCRAEVQPEGHILGEPTGENRSKLLLPGDREIEAALLIEAFVPSHGWADYRPYVSFSVTGGGRGADPDPAAQWPGMTLNDEPFLPLQSKPVARSLPEPPKLWTAWGGAAGVRALTERMILFKPVVVPGAAAPDARLRFSGSASDPALQLKLSIFDDPGSASSGRAGQGDLVQVIPLDIPDLGVLAPSEVPLPSLPEEGMAFTIEKRLRQARTGKRLFSLGDVVQSMVPVHGDYRILAAQPRAEAPAGSTQGNAGHPLFVTHPLWGKARFAHSLQEPSPEARSSVLGFGREEPSPANPGSSGYFARLKMAPATTPDFPLHPYDEAQGAWAVINGETSWVQSSALCDWNRLDDYRRGPARPDITGDFDNGLGNAPDGPYINRPDDGNLHPLAKGDLPYFSPEDSSAGNEVPPVSPDIFSAHRMFPSPVMFGSLPTGAASMVPWQTLLFRPQPGHYGAKTPPDHLLLDLFWTPVLEPEPLSRALETAGRINLNHAIVPFSYIHRSTALHAAMKAETLMAIPDTASETFKSGGSDRFRHFIDAAATIKLWDQSVFTRGQVFLTPGEICGHYLVPEGSRAATLDSLREFWNRHRLTGDNTKERPYADLYARFTTRSNVFRVHFIAETIRPDRTNDPSRIDLTRDTIAASLRGSCLIRRELDVNDPRIPDYAATAQNRPPLDAFYNWRISEWKDER